MEYMKGIAYTSPLNETLYVHPDYEKCIVYAYIDDISPSTDYSYSLVEGKWTNNSSTIKMQEANTEYENPITDLLYSMWNRYLVSKYTAPAEN